MNLNRHPRIDAPKETKKFVLDNEIAGVVIPIEYNDVA